MALTKKFSETVKNRAAQDSEFRTGLLSDASELFLHGEVAAAKILLRDYVNATIGFQGLSERVGLAPKSLMRMLSPSGNPTATNLSKILAALQHAESISLVVRHDPAA